MLMKDIRLRKKNPHKKQKKSPQTGPYCNPFAFEFIRASLYTLRMIKTPINLDKCCEVFS